MKALESWDEMKTHSSRMIVIGVPDVLNVQISQDKPVYHGDLGTKTPRNALSYQEEECSFHKQNPVLEFQEFRLETYMHDIIDLVELTEEKGLHIHCGEPFVWERIQLAKDGN